LGHGDGDGAEAGGFRGDGGWVRGRSGSGEVLRHQVPQGRADTGGGGDRGDGAGDEVQRRGGAGRPRGGERGRGARGRGEPRAAHRQCPRLRRAGRGGNEPFRGRHGGRDRGADRGGGRRGRRGRGLPPLGRGRRGGRGTRAP